jgi:hypothetical protein
MNQQLAYKPYLWKGMSGTAPRPIVAIREDLDLRRPLAQHIEDELWKERDAVSDLQIELQAIVTGHKSEEPPRSIDAITTDLEPHAQRVTQLERELYELHVEQASLRRELREALWLGLGDYLFDELVTRRNVAALRLMRFRNNAGQYAFSSFSVALALDQERPVSGADKPYIPMLRLELPRKQTVQGLWEACTRMNPGLGPEAPLALITLLVSAQGFLELYERCPKFNDRYLPPTADVRDLLPVLRQEMERIAEVS